MDVRVFVTGAANGIGKATVERLVERDHKVIAYDIDSEGLEKLPEPVETYEGDVRERERLEEVIRQEIFGVLVNCAGFQEQGSVEDMPVEKFEEHIDINFYGTLNSVKAAVPMLTEREGKIVNVSSIAGKTTVPFLGAYSSSKHAVEALNDALRMEMKERGVDVVKIQPGPIRTGFNEIAEEALEKYIPGSEYTEKYRKRMDSGKPGAKPEKAAKVIVKAVESRRPKHRYNVTAQAYFITRLKPLVPSKLYDFLARRY